MYKIGDYVMIITGKYTSMKGFITGKYDAYDGIKGKYYSVKLDSGEEVLGLEEMDLWILKKGVK